MKRVVLASLVALLALAGSAAAAVSRERVPPGVRRVDIQVGYPGQAPKISLRIGERAQVERIVTLLDGLRTARTGIYNCPDITVAAARASFSFRSADGALVAHASMLDFGTAGPCDPIQLSIRGRQQRPLVGSFLSRVQRLLGVRLVLPPPTAS